MIINQNYELTEKIEVFEQIKLTLKRHPNRSFMLNLVPLPLALI
jgi:hypothetical protein